MQRRGWSRAGRPGEQDETPAHLGAAPSLMSQFLLRAILALSLHSEGVGGPQHHMWVRAGLLALS